MTRITMLLAAALVAAACSEPTVPGTPDVGAPLSAVSPRPDAEHRDLAALRAATAHFHDRQAAFDAGYGEQFPPGCFRSDDNETEGAMGYHYIDWERVGSLDPTQPQLIIYERQRNGQFRLVGVEFIHPGSPDDDPPVLFGQPFTWHEVFEVWVLHVWAWRNNPSGMYKPWNPRVTCRWADDIAAQPHH